MTTGLVQLEVRFLPRQQFGVIVQWSMHVQLKNMSVRLFESILKNAPLLLGVIDVRFVVAPQINFNSQVNTYFDNLMNKDL